MTGPREKVIGLINVFSLHYGCLLIELSTCYHHHHHLLLEICELQFLYIYFVLTILSV